MRALCGAIITAGALIGLGLAAIGIGVRFQGTPADTDLVHAHIGPWLGYIVTFLTILTIIGVATAFVGLALHHERRHHERLHLHGGAGAVPPSTTAVPR